MELVKISPYTRYDFLPRRALKWSNWIETTQYQYRLKKFAAIRFSLFGKAYWIYEIDLIIDTRRFQTFMVCFRKLEDYNNMPQDDKDTYLCLSNFKDKISILCSCGNILQLNRNCCKCKSEEKTVFMYIANRIDHWTYPDAPNKELIAEINEKVWIQF